MKKMITMLAIMLLIMSCASTKEEMKDDAKEQGVVQDGPYKGYKITESGLMYKDVVVGAGVVPMQGSSLVVHYHGTLEDGTVFDSSVERNKPFTFNLGGNVIKGWNEGLATMKEGGKRILVIPPDLAYGDRARNKIPANATLIFEIELLEVN